MDSRQQPRRNLFNVMGDLIEVATSDPMSDRRSGLLTNLLQEDNPTVLWAALQELGRAGQASAIEDIEPLLSHQDVTVRRAAEDAIRRIQQRTGATPAPPPPPPPPLRPRPAYVPPPVAPT
ncbi:MAG: HEAT repeat domain-containing protein, partial [Armatimonadetes bacterium]|nr:HEAT repeat domain-containing protein [Armatimonadota bacterium]